MDALKSFVTSRRLNSAKAGSDGKYDGEMSMAVSREKQLSSNVTTVWSTSSAVTGLPSRKVSGTSTTYSRIPLSGTASSSEFIYDVITGTLDIPESVVLTEYELQVVFQYLRELGEPCTLYGESDQDKLRRCRHSDGQSVHKKAHISRGLVRKLNEPTDPVDWNSAIWIVDFGVDVIKIIKSWLRERLKAWHESITTKYYQNMENDVSLFHKTREDVEAYMKRWALQEFNYDMLRLIASITEAVRKSDFNLANEQYMKLSIGNVAWPIGVGNWGIQERAANDRIGTTGHALNDEETRKFIQAIKRLITREEK